MEFHAVQDTYSFTKARKRAGLSVDAFYKLQQRRLRQRYGAQKTFDAGADSGFRADLAIEWAWWKNGRPYYNVWPAMVEILDKFDCSNVPYRSFVEAPDPAIVLRFPVGCEYRNAMCLSVAVFCADRDMAFILFCIQRNECGRLTEEFGQEYLTQSSAISIARNQLDTAFKDGPGAGPFIWNDGDADSEADVNALQKFGLAILLMERDSQIFEPDILAKDLGKYAAADDDGKIRLQEKSFRRRGQRGYHVGRKLESIPHFRRPHPAIFWVGKGRHTARVVIRSGCVVNRQRMTKAPTGFMGAFGEAETDGEV